MFASVYAVTTGQACSAASQTDVPCNDVSCADVLLCIHRYMSPERLAGEGYGAPGDIWSLGILLLEMATRCVATPHL
jgi:serine/threonine protein kinase